VFGAVRFEQNTIPVVKNMFRNKNYGFSCSRLGGIRVSGKTGFRYGSLAIGILTPDTCYTGGQKY
jgi:hypothetical protein